MKLWRTLNFSDLPIVANDHSLQIVNEAGLRLRRLERHIKRELKSNPRKFSARWIKALDEVQSHSQYYPVAAWEDRLPY